MSVVSMKHLLERALQGGYALGYFESWDQYSLEAALAAAEEAHAPAILGFGAAVTNQGWLDHGGVEVLSGLARRLAERASVPCAVLFNEARTMDQIRRALDSGCNAVMLDTSELPYDQNVALTRRVVAAAHTCGAAVEAELGHLADAVHAEVRAAPTDPVEAERFVAATGIDALAVAIGNTHLVLHGEVEVDLPRLAAIHETVPVPLVVHGGSGFPPAAVQAAIRSGAAKFNVGTRLKRTFLAGVRQALPDPDQIADVHPFVGSRDEADVVGHGMALMRAEIVRLMHLYGCAGRAGEA